MTVIFSITIYTMFLLFVGICVYQLALVTGQLNKIKNRALKIKPYIPKLFCPKQNTSRVRDRHLDNTSTSSMECYREPLIYPPSHNTVG